MSIARYSPKNWQKITDSMPTATNVKSRKEWNAEGREIILGAWPLHIWAPIRFDYVEGRRTPVDWRECPVYDISQTDPMEVAIEYDSIPA